MPATVILKLPVEATNSNQGLEQLIKKVSQLDLTTYDSNADFMTVESQIEYNHNIRLRRSRKGTGLMQVNTTRNEQIEVQHEEDEEKRVNKKLPIIGRFQQ